MANLTGNQKLAILAVVVIAVLYLIYMQKEGVEGKIDNSNSNTNNSDSVSAGTMGTMGTIETVESNDVNYVNETELDKELIRKMTGPNSAPVGKEKVLNYRDGERGGFSSNLDQFFEEGNPLNNENGDFYPNDPDNLHAAYSAKPKKELSEEEKFNASELLPKEERQDWFEDVTPQKIKNRHLINIYRPIGVNTVITSRKNPSLDLRGNPVNPKTFVSPFLNSSIDPDVNARGICS
jgi:hypothetical protein